MGVNKVATFSPSEKTFSGGGTFLPGEVKGIIRINPNKCVGCDTCRNHCPAHAIKGSLGVTHHIEEDLCLSCGQCLVNCPFGAIEQLSFLDEVLKRLKDPDYTVVAIIAPAVRVALAEEFGAPPGTLTVHRMHAAFKKAGFRIYENNLAADQTIMEEGYEFIAKVKYWLLGERTPELEKFAKHPLPHFTSCCPAWIRYAELYWPEILPHISGAKSPQQMAGATVKTWVALKLWNIDPRKIYTVGIMPCTAKIYEASRPEFKSAFHWLKEKGYLPEDTPPFPDVDAVLTTRDAAELFRRLNINPLSASPEKETDITEVYTGGATIFGNSGGVTEAALRTAYCVLSGKEPASWNIEAVRGYTTGIRTAKITIPLKALGGKEVDFNICVVNGIHNHIEPILRDVVTGKSPFHFIEVMNCPGGCINGGGQPVNPMGTSWIDPLLPLPLKA